MTAPFRADLHCHTTCSDGSATPSEVVQNAVKIGLNGLSITDHDTIDAYATALPEADKLKLRMISGVEFSATLKDISIHILAYSFDLRKAVIRDYCHKHQLRREERNSGILGLLSQHGMPITEAELAEAANSQNYPGRTIGRPHIAKAMINKGYVDTVQNAFKKYIGEGKSCYVPGVAFSIEETLHVIHQAKGLAFIAHPHLIEKSSTVKDLLNMPFDGLEAYYGKFEVNIQDKWVRLAKKKNLLISGGSDFHGEIRPHVPLGASWIDEENFKILYSHFKLNQI
jgi:predicted metal-dependent phosphoesterase TrpH